MGQSFYLHSVGQKPLQHISKSLSSTDNVDYGNLKFFKVQMNDLAAGLWNTNSKTPTTTHTGPRDLVKVMNIFSCSEKASGNKSESVSHTDEMTVKLSVG